MKAYNEFWWDTPPELSITTHYAENPVFNNLGYYVSKAQFEQMEPIRKYISKSTVSNRPRIAIGGGYGFIIDSSDDLRNKTFDRQLNLMLGGMWGRRGEGQNYLGMFTTLDLTEGYPLTVEGGLLIMRFIRMSGGFRVQSYLNQKTTMGPSITGGLQIHLGCFYGSIDLNGYLINGAINNRFIASAGVCF